jgi:hypothetical protein
MFRTLKVKFQWKVSCEPILFRTEAVRVKSNERLSHRKVLLRNSLVVRPVKLAKIATQTARLS